MKLSIWHWFQWLKNAIFRKLAVMSFKFEFIISTRIQFDFIATVGGNLYRIWDAYFELAYYLNFASHRLRALIDDYNSLLIKVRKKSDEFNAKTIAVSTRLETLYSKQLCKAWIFILSLLFCSRPLLKFLQATRISWAAS